MKDSTGLSYIVLPTDLSPGGEVAFGHALALALGSKGHLALVHAEPLQADEKPDWSAFPGVRATLDRWGLLDADSTPTTVGQRLGVKVSKTDVSTTDVVHGVAGYVAQHAGDFLVLATDGREGLSRLIEPSISERIAHATNLPALFIPKDAKGFVDWETGAARLRRIVLPVEPELPPGTTADLALRMADLLGCTEAELHLLDFKGGDEEGLIGLSDELQSRVRRKAVEGDLVAGVQAAVQELEADLVALPTRDETGLLDRLRGSSTARLLAEVGLPVLAVPLD